MRATLPGLLCLTLAACASAPKVQPTNFAWADIQPIIEPLTYRALWLRQCDKSGSMEPVVSFVRELMSLGASSELLEQARVETNRIGESVRDEEDEYVCTVELAESTENNAAAAQAVWAALKKRTS